MIFNGIIENSLVERAIISPVAAVTRTAKLPKKYIKKKDRKPENTQEDDHIVDEEDDKKVKKSLINKRKYWINQDSENIISDIKEAKGRMSCL